MDQISTKRPLDVAGITALVHGFYAEVRADAQLGPLFDRAIEPHWDAHLARMVDFWSTVMLGARSERAQGLFMVPARQKKAAI